MASDGKLLCKPDEKADLEIANQAAVVEFLADFVHKGRTRITRGDVLEIHRLTIGGIYPCAGNFRDARTKVEITGTTHTPASPATVRSQVDDMLEWLYGPGKARPPVQKAAYILWKVNAIHPFNGGNGRVARALAYLVILSEVAPIFAGEPLPTKLKMKKREYLDALQAADGGNLAPLEQLVLQCFQEQLSDIARKAKGKP